MCCFSRPVEHVSETQIFARDGGGGRQMLAYSMNVSAVDDLAMVLPLPVPPGAPEDAVRFIDLHGYTMFFHDLGKAFPVHFDMGMPSLSAAPRSAPQKLLAVQAVGDFEASFVPSIPDFERLDPRFRLSPEVWAEVPAYADYGFAVFKLKGFGKTLLERLLRRSRPMQRKNIHPMVFEFPRRDPSRLFFPTVHVHDGEVHPMARFDHFLYWQSATDAAPQIQGVWAADPVVATAGDVARVVDIPRTRGIVDPTLPCRRSVLQGVRLNDDVYVAA